MQKRWLIKDVPNTETWSKLQQELAIEKPLAILLAQRGIKTFDQAQAFFRPKLEDLHDPFLMKDMDKAVARIQKALQTNERILLFGDYDVDGTTAVATLWNVLIEHYKQLDLYIPDRYSEGYGVSFQGIDYASDNDITLIIALDCGVKAHDKIEYANKKGIDFIVCDHHEPGETLPDCIVLDPKRKDCSYPYKELSGCGVGFKLMQALFQCQNWETEILFQQLDLLAISIGADIVPITGENRILCYHGLQAINQQPRPGIAAILKTAKKELPLNLTNVVFIIAPRINAAGRIHSGIKAVHLMVSEDLEELEAIAKQIDADNTERRALDQAITAEALLQIEEDHAYSDRITTMVYQPDWHKGVIGIVASRLIEQHYRPTIVLTESNGKVAGSARSIRGLDIHEALNQCSDVLEQFGGHAFAAGMTLPIENVTIFKERFDSVVRSLIKPEDLVPQQLVDYELEFDEIFLPGEQLNKVPKLKRILNQLEPHGPGNMKPVFVTRNVFVKDVRILKEAHLKCIFGQPNSKVTIDGIGFNLLDKYDLCSNGLPVDILYTLETNSWRDLETIQLNIKDIRSTI